MARISQYAVKLSLIGLLGLYACTQPDTAPQKDTDYAPVESGRYWVYAVQDERYSLTEAPILNAYFVKETIGERLSVTQDSQTYKLIRAKRNRTTDTWKTDSIWTVQQWPDKLIRIENNTAYVKLRFPVVGGTSWNQNEYNALSASLYQYVKPGELFSLTAKSYANTVQVVSRQSDSTAISLNRRIDVYAYQTGLIFKENTALAYCQSSPDCIGKGQITSGYRQKWTLVETGNE